MKKLNLLLKLNLLILFILSLSMLIQGCKKSDIDTGSGGGKATYSVRMTDAPGPYQAVKIDVQGVEITGDGGKNVLLNVHAGIYNLLDFTNGLDTMIATGPVDAGTIQQIRLILGPNNTVVVNNDTYLLTVPSGEQSGLKLQVHQKVEAGVAYTVLLDFDANKSIILQGNGEYKLKPVIRTVTTAISGSIKGSIAPVGVLAVVSAENGVDTFTTSVNANGNFMIMGLPPGTYNVTITPASPYNPVTIPGVTVNTGICTDVGLTNL